MEPGAGGHVAEGTQHRLVVRRFLWRFTYRKTRRLFMRSILLGLLGVPIPIILLLAFCTHHF